MNRVALVLTAIGAVALNPLAGATIQPPEPIMTAPEHGPESVEGYDCCWIYIGGAWWCIPCG